MTLRQITTTTSLTSLGNHSGVVCSNGNAVDFWLDPATGTLKYVVSADGWASPPSAAVDTGIGFTGSYDVHIDDADNIYIAYANKVTTTTVWLRRLVPNAARNAWTVEAAFTVHATGVANSGKVAVRVHAEGTGVIAHCVYESDNGTTFNLFHVPVTVTSAGAMTNGTRTTVASGTSSNVFKEIAVGGPTGKNIVTVWAAGYRRASYNAGAWTWATAVASTDVRGPVYLNADGSFDVLDSADGIISANPVKHRRVAADGTATTIFEWVAKRSAAAIVALAWDQYGNLFAFYQTNTAGNAMVMRSFLRSTGVWSAETVVGTSAATPGQLPATKRGYAGNAVDVMFYEGAASPYNVMHYRMTLNTDPTMPTNLSPANGFAFDGNTAQTFSAIFTDGDPGAVATAYEFQWSRTDLAGTNTTGKVAITSGNPSAGQPFTFQRAAGAHANGYDWQYQVRFWDEWDRPSPWSLPATFRTSASPTVAITSPVPGATLNSPVITPTWAVSDPESRGQGWYREKLYNVDRTATLWDSTKTQGTENGRTIGTTPAPGAYQIGVQVWDADGIASPEVYVSFTLDYTPAPTPLGDVINNGDQWPPHIAMKTTNPAPGAGQPAVVSNRWERSENGTDGWAPIGECEPNGTVEDYGAASGTPYWYRPVAIGANGTESVGTAHMGRIDRDMWVFAPDGAPELAVAFRYSWDVAGGPQQAITDVENMGPVPVVFEGGTDIEVFSLTGQFINPTDTGFGLIHTAARLTKEQWRKRFLAIRLMDGYLCAPNQPEGGEGGVWYGALRNPQWRWSMDGVHNPLYITVQFRQTGDVPGEV